MKKKGRSTVYNKGVTSKEILEKVNIENIELENEWLEYLKSADKSMGTIKQYKATLHVFWCWNYEYNKNKFFIDITKREFTKFQVMGSTKWNWSPKRLITVKATLRSLENYIVKILDEEYPDYKPKVCNIESPKNEAIREKTVFTKRKLQKLLNTLVEEERYMQACALALSMYSGRRKSELTRFKVSYFDDENLICKGGLYKTPEKIKTKGRGTSGKLLDVYVLAKPFKPYLDLWLQERKELGLKTDWLFPKYVKDGKSEISKWFNEPVEPGTLDSWANTFTSRIKDTFYWHSMRHFFTTSLLEANLPENVVQDILGWSSPDMVRIYDDRNKEEQFEKFFDGDGIKKIKKTSLDEL